MPLIISKFYQNLTDQFNNFTKTRLHFEGPDGFTGPFTDTSSGGVAYQPVGTPRLSTQTSAVGTSSLYLDGSSSLVAPWYESLWLSNDFTIETWINTSTIDASRVFIMTVGEGWGIGYPSWSLNRQGSSVRFTSFYADAPNSTLVDQTFGTLVPNTWYHVAVTRQGDTWRFFLNGVLQSTKIASGTPYRNTDKKISMGGDTYGYVDRFFKGYIDELRITKGVARYTASFVPSREPFPDE